MSDEAKSEETEADAAADDESEGKGGTAGLKKKALLFGLPALILLFAAAGAFMLFGGGGDKPRATAEAGHAVDGAPDGAGVVDAQGAASAHGEYVFYELPEMLVNINTEDGEAKYLKLKLVLELRDEALVETLDARLPRVIDQYQTFLRELRVEDLSGSAGMYRLRHELLRRVNLAVAPAEVNNVLVEEILFR